MAITETGRDLWAYALSNGNNGFTGTANAIEAKKIKLTAAGWTASAFVGQDVVCENAVATILTNGTEELTFLRWEKPGKRNELATLPGGTSKLFVILGGATSAQWMALSKSATEGIKISEWKEELWKSGGGLNRQIAEWAHTLGTNTYTLKATFTANGSDTLPATVQSIGVFNSFTEAEGGPTGQRQLFMTKLATSATLSTSGDSVAVTDTVTGS